MIKVTGIMRRVPSMTRADFITYHRHSHGPLFMSITASQKHVVRYIQSHPLSTNVFGLPDTTYDGITEIWFEDLDSCAAVFTNADYMAIVRPDELKFIDFARSELFISEEFVIKA